MKSSPRFPTVGNNTGIPAQEMTPEKTILKLQGIDGQLKGSTRSGGTEIEINYSSFQELTHQEHLDMLSQMAP